MKIEHDGVIYMTTPIENIRPLTNDNVYKFEFVLFDRTIKSSETHMWGIWCSDEKKIKMVKMSELKKGDLLILQE